MKSIRVLSNVIVCAMIAFLVGICFTVRADDKPVAKETPRLVINKATYGDLAGGDAAKISDVTDKVKGMVTAEGLTVVASNDNFGDPAENIQKQLKIEYTLDGEKKDQTVTENETLTITVKATAKKEGEAAPKKEGEDAK